MSGDGKYKAEGTKHVITKVVKNKINTGYTLRLVEPTPIESRLEQLINALQTYANSGSSLLPVIGRPNVKIMPLLLGTTTPGIIDLAIGLLVNNLLTVESYHSIKQYSALILSKIYYSDEYEELSKKLGTLTDSFPKYAVQFRPTDGVPVAAYRAARSAPGGPKPGPSSKRMGSRIMQFEKK
jgi:hypothetical protein